MPSLRLIGLLGALLGSSLWAYQEGAQTENHSHSSAVGQGGALSAYLQTTSSPTWSGVHVFNQYSNHRASTTFDALVGPGNSPTGNINFDGAIQAGSGVTKSTINSVGSFLGATNADITLTGPTAFITAGSSITGNFFGSGAGLTGITQGLISSNTITNSIKLWSVKAVNNSPVASSSGCPVATWLTTIDNNATWVFTSTTTSSLTRSTGQRQRPGILLDICPVGATCEVLLAGVGLASTATELSSGQGATFASNARCKLEGSLTPPNDNTIGYPIVLDSDGVVGAGQEVWINLLGY